MVNHDVNQDTIRLLRECSAGTKMAVSSIDEVTDRVTNARLRRLLAESRQQHETLGGEIHKILVQNQSEEKEPTPMAKGMSWLKTNMKMTMNESDAAIADLMTDGCNMGVKTLHKYLNQYTEANPASKSLCRRLAAEEERLGQNLRAFL